MSPSIAALGVARGKEGSEAPLMSRPRPKQEAEEEDKKPTHRGRFGDAGRSKGLPDRFHRA